MRLVGMSFGDEINYGLEGQLRLPGCTVLYGLNGAGKTRTLAAVDAFTTRDGPVALEVGRLFSDATAYGHLFLQLDRLSDVDSSENRWLAELCAVQDIDAHDPEAFEEALAGATETSGSTALWLRLRESAVAKLPGDSGVRAAAEALLVALTQQPVLSYQNHMCGLIELVAHPRLATPLAHQVARAFTDKVPAGTWVHAATQALLYPELDEPFIPLLPVATLPDGRELYEQLRLDLPRVCRVDVDPDEVEALVDEYVDVRLPRRSETGAARWTTPGSEGNTAVAQPVLDLLRAVEERATTLAPDFLRTEYLIHVAVADMEEWSAGTPRTLVTVTGHDGEAIHYLAAGAGFRRWIAAAVTEACRQLADEQPRPHDSVVRPAVAPRRLLLVDEPELHLHSTAVGDVARWLRARVAQDLGVVLASHAPELLRLHGDDVATVWVLREPAAYPAPDRTTARAVSRLLELPADLLGTVRDLADDMGLDPRTWVMLLRGVLIVEGEHDRKVVDRFFGRDLAAARVHVQPLRGTKNTKAIIDSELLGSLGAPLHVMYDDTRAAALTGGQAPRSPEEKVVVWILDQLKHQRHAGHDVRPVAYPEPDVLCALPPEALRRAYPHAHFPGWEPVLRQWAHVTGRGFKPWLLTLLGLKGEDPDSFLDTVLRHVREDDQPSHALRRAIGYVLDDMRLRQ